MESPFDMGLVKDLLELFGEIIADLTHVKQQKSFNLQLKLSGVFCLLSYDDFLLLPNSSLLVACSFAISIQSGLEMNSSSL